MDELNTIPFPKLLMLSVVMPYQQGICYSGHGAYWFQREEGTVWVLRIRALSIDRARSNFDKELSRRGKKGVFYSLVPREAEQAKIDELFEDMSSGNEAIKIMQSVL